jgi:hypothetical protein
VDVVELPDFGNGGVIPGRQAGDVCGQGAGGIVVGMGGVVVRVRVLGVVVGMGVWRQQEAIVVDGIVWEGTWL